MNLKSYLIGSTIVWAAIIMATAVILKGTPYFAQMLPIVGSGAAWFVVVSPPAFREKNKRH